MLLVVECFIWVFFANQLQSIPYLYSDIFEIDRNEITFGRQLGAGQFGVGFPYFLINSSYQFLSFEFAIGNCIIINVNILPIILRHINIIFQCPFFWLCFSFLF